MWYDCENCIWGRYCPHPEHSLRYVCDKHHLYPFAQGCFTCHEPVFSLPPDGIDEDYGYGEYPQPRVIPPTLLERLLTLIKKKETKEE